MANVKINKNELIKVQYNWAQDILSRINLVIKSKNYTDKEKIIAVEWLTKQALKTDKE